MPKTVLIFKILLSAILLTIVFYSCKKADMDPVPMPMGTLMFHLHTNINATEVDSAVSATDATGRKFQLDVAQYYVSGVVLHKTDGTNYSVPNVFLLKTISQEVYLVGNVPAGNYTSVSFNIGLDATTNGTNPASYPSYSPLSPQQPTMWFGSTAQGYEFVNIQGVADTTTTHTGSINCPFSYQLGTMSLLRRIDMPYQPFVVLAGQTQYVHMITDYGILLQGVNFKTQNRATPFTNMLITTQIANNIPAMIRYEM
jgi:hypothetical protein